MPIRHGHFCALLIYVLGSILLIAVTGANAQNVPNNKQVDNKKNEEQLKKEVSQLLAEADALYRQKRYEEAIPLQQRALALREEFLGPEHSEVGDVLFIMGVTYQQMG